MVSLVCLEIHGLSQVFPLKWLFNGLPHHQFLLSYILSYHITIPISSYHIPYTCTITYIHLHLRLLTYLPERSHSQSHLRSNFANLPIFQTFHELFYHPPPLPRHPQGLTAQRRPWAATARRNRGPPPPRPRRARTGAAAPGGPVAWSRDRMGPEDREVHGGIPKRLDLMGFYRDLMGF